MKPIILIADTEEAIRDSLKFVLSEEGFDSHVATSREEALQKLQQNHFDLVIADISLVNSNAKDFFGTLQSSSSSPEILVTTSYENVRDILSLMHYGVVEYLIKPFEFDELLERVKRLLYKYQNKQ